MYEAHFGISAPPFQLSPDPAFYFDSQGHRDALAVLRRGLTEARGMVLVSGEIGAGKTTLVRTLLETIDPASLVVGQVLSTQLDAAELLRAILLAFGAPAEQEDEASLRQALQAHVAALGRDGRRPVLIVDEAQNLHRSAFEMLVELEAGATAGGLPLKICLVGQPELRGIVASPDLTALAARVGASCHLSPLTAEETGAYVLHRLHKVGWSGTPAFGADALAEIHRCTQGIPRRINLLCNRLMLACFLARKTAIDPAMVAQTASDLRAEIGDTTVTVGALAPADDASEAVPVAAGDAPAAAPQAVDDTPVEVKDAAHEVGRASPASPVAPDLPVLTQVVGGSPEGRALVLVVGSQADHLQAAVLLKAFAARGDLPVALLVRTYANNAFERNREMFAELDIDGRVVPLGIAGGTYAGRASELMRRFEFVVEQCAPVAVVVFDGSDAALACGLVASRRAIPVVQIGAGLRAKGTPGAADITRKLTDQLSDVLYTSEIQASERLVQEGIARDRVALVGNLQIDALQAALRTAMAGGPRERPGLPAQYLADRNGYGIVVVDAPANVNDRQTLADLVAILKDISRDVPLVWPMHSRTREQLMKFRLDAAIRGERVVCLPEQGYVSFVQLLANATCVLTDSWHVQEETTALGIPCLALGVEGERPISSSEGSTVPVGRNKALATRMVWDCIFNGGRRGTVPDLWDGQTGPRIAEHLAMWLRVQQSPAAVPEASLIRAALP